MSTGGSAIRGSRVGAGPMGEQDRGFKAERITVSYFCSAGHEYSPQYAANVETAEIPELIDCPSCGLPAGQDKANPPIVTKHEPYKTHLAYVKERRTATEAKELLDEAVAAVRERRIRLAEEAKVAAKDAAKAATKKAAADAKAAKAALKPAAKVVEKPVAKAPAKTEAKATAKITSKPAAKPVAKASAKSAAKAPAKSVAKPAAKKAVKPAAKTAKKK
ncbi:MAG: RNA polymerase-binding protein RbpA [Rhodoluna sp.]|nr:RNA polymerase-binding protein RbpA [Rhodoluna sp.]